MKLDPDETFKYLLANLLILAPLPALLMAILGTRIHLWIVLLGALILSGGIEVLQYTMWTYRVADVDDVIMNVGGAVLAFMILRRLMGGQPRLDRSVKR
jgi:glycopeptide antibiotics resistance protein